MVAVFVLAVMIGVFARMLFHPTPPHVSQDVSNGFQLPDVTGKMRNSHEWLGQVVVLNFWAPWCPPCREEIPGFLSLYHTYRDRGLVVVGVGLDQLDEIRAFIQRFQVDYPNLLGNEDGGALADRYGDHSGSLPYTVVLSRAGEVVYRHLGGLSVTDLEGIVRPLLGSSTQSGTM